MPGVVMVFDAVKVAKYALTSLTRTNIGWSPAFRASLVVNTGEASTTTHNFVIKNGNTIVASKENASISNLTASPYVDVPLSANITFYSVYNKTLDFYIDNELVGSLIATGNWEISYSSSDITVSPSEGLKIFFRPIDIAGRLGTYQTGLPITFENSAGTKVTTSWFDKNPEGTIVSGNNYQIINFASLKSQYLNQGYAFGNPSTNIYATGVDCYYPVLTLASGVYLKASNNGNSAYGVTFKGPAINVKVVIEAKSIMVYELSVLPPDHSQDENSDLCHITANNLIYYLMQHYDSEKDYIGWNGYPFYDFMDDMQEKTQEWANFNDYTEPVSPTPPRRLYLGGDGVDLSEFESFLQTKGYFAAHCWSDLVFVVDSTNSPYLSNNVLFALASEFVRLRDKYSLGEGLMTGTAPKIHFVTWSHSDPREELKLSEFVEEYLGKYTENPHALIGEGEDFEWGSGVDWGSINNILEYYAQKLLS